MKKMKRVLSLVLTVLLLSTCLSVPFPVLAYNESTSNSMKNVTISVSAAQSKYEWGDAVYFNVVATNNGIDPAYNINISSIPKKTTWFFEENKSGSAQIDVLDAGESTTVQIMYSSERLPLYVRAFILPITAIVDSIVGLTFNLGAYDAVCKAKVGVFSYKFGFSVNDNAAVDPTAFDKDGNGIPDCVENKDYTTDTDEDGLSDYQEFMFTCTSPLLVDTDGDGINDAESDNDRDSLSNKYELSIGADPLKEDTDDDYLNDADEIAARTDPLKPDTDSDGAKDGWELQNGYNPLVYNRSFTIVGTSSSNNDNAKVTASVSLNGNGKQTDTLIVKEITKNDNALVSDKTAGFLGNAYDFSIDGSFESATLTFNYDKSLGTIGNSFQPRIYYLNENNGLLEELPNQTVKNGTVSATTTHFSTYILLNKVDFDKIWNEDIRIPEDWNVNDTSLDIVFVIDYSASMDWNDPQKIHRSLSKAFIEKFRNNLDRGAVVKFIRSATLVQSLTSNKMVLNNALDSIVYDDGYGTLSGTDGSTGIKLALDQLNNSNAAYKYIVFLTDGEDNGYTYSYSDLINRANQNSVTIYSIGLGDASTTILERLSSETAGKFYMATSGSDPLTLDEIYKEIENETIDYSIDSNNDGINDYYTQLIKEGKLLPGNGSHELVGIDLNSSADYDEDGLLNGEEVKVVEKNGKIYLYYYSSPIEKDTESDGIADADDTAPLTKGLKGGIVGALKIVSYGAGPSSVGNINGHAFITYTSFINDVLAVYGVTINESNTVTSEKDNNWVKKNSFQWNTLRVFPNEMISIGTWAGWLNENQRGTFINNEKYIFAPKTTIKGQYSLTKYITEGELRVLEHCTYSESYWGEIKNCSWFACVAWDAVTGEKLSSVGLFPNPATLSNNIKKRSDREYEQSFVASRPNK